MRGIPTGSHGSNQDPLWQPIPELTKNGQCGMAELIVQAMQA